MSAVNDEYINALLADAADVSDLQEGLSRNDLADLLSPRITQPQAAFIAANFSVVSHFESDDLTGSGFDGTVWRGNEGTPYAGRVYVSMQGTQGLGDLLSDYDLAAKGAARRQSFAGATSPCSSWCRWKSPGSRASRVRARDKFSVLRRISTRFRKVSRITSDACPDRHARLSLVGRGRSGAVGESARSALRSGKRMPAYCCANSCL